MKIDRAAWPEIRKRRVAGETLSQIARDYAVTPGTISAIVKRAQATAPDARDGSEAEEARPARPDAPSAAPQSATAEQEAPGVLAEGAGEDLASAKASARPSTAAQQLVEAAHICATRLAAGAPPGDVARAAEAVRRALAGLEMAQAKRAGTAKRRGAAPLPRAASSRPNAAGPMPPAALATAASPSAPGSAGGFLAPESGQGAGRLRGTVKFYDPEKGFGFITPDDGSKDVFVARKTLEALGLTRIGEGDRVVVQVAAGSKGPEASTVKIE